MYLNDKLPIHKLAKRYGVSESTIKRTLRTIEITWRPSSIPSTPLYLHIDVTYEGRDWGVIAAISHEGKYVYYRAYISGHEKVIDYVTAIEDIVSRNGKIAGIVLDGFKGVFKHYDGVYPLQMCHFHFKQIIRRTLTQRPKLKASKELKKIIDNISETTEDAFTMDFSTWEKRWLSFVNERSKGKNDKRSHYKHKRLYSAYKSTKYFLPYLFTYQHIDGLPNTNNKIEGMFTTLKDHLEAHNGLHKENRPRVMDGFFLAWVLPQ